MNSFGNYELGFYSHLTEPQPYVAVDKGSDS